MSRVRCLVRSPKNDLQDSGTCYFTEDAVANSYFTVCVARIEFRIYHKEVVIFPCYFSLLYCAREGGGALAVSG